MVCFYILADQKAKGNTMQKGEWLGMLGLVRAYDGMLLVMINLLQCQPLDGLGWENQL